MTGSLTPLLETSGLSVDLANSLTTTIDQLASTLPVGSDVLGGLTSGLGLGSVETGPHLREGRVCVPCLPISPGPPGADDHSLMQRVQRHEDLTSDPTGTAAGVLQTLAHLVDVETKFAFL